MRHRSWASMVGLGLGLGLGLGSARAHFAPSPDKNNRYLKVTCLGDEIRVTYTAFFGEKPGHALRARIDTGGDGTVDPDEARRFGEGVLGEIAGQVELMVDGQAQKAWKIEDVGLGTPTTLGGALSVDLQLVVPVSTPGSHQVRLVDGWRVPNPGETETRFEESPGVRVVSAHLEREPSGLQLRWAWPDEAADPRSRALVATCLSEQPAQRTTEAGPPSPAPRSHLWVWVALAALALGGGTALVTLRSRSRRVQRASAGSRGQTDR